MRIQWAALFCALASCADLSTYAGSWSGAPVADPSLLAGLPPTAGATLRLDTVDRTAIGGTLTVAGEAVALRPLARAGNDSLGSLDLPDAPLRSYFTVAPL